MQKYFQAIERSLKKLLRTDIAYLSKGGFWVSFGFFLKSLLGLISQIAFANLISKELYGNLRYIKALLASLTCFSMTGMNTAVTTSLAKNQPNVLLPSIILQLRWNLIMSAALLVCAAAFKYAGNSEFALIFIVMSVLSPLNSALSTYNAALIGLHLFKRATISQAIVDLIYIACSLLVLIYLPQLFFLAVIPSLSSLLIHLYFLRDTLKLESAARKHQNHENKSDPDHFGIKLSGINFISVAAQQLDKIILLHSSGASAVASLAIAAAIPDRLRGFIKNLGLTILPKLSEKNARQTLRTLSFRTLQLTLLGLLSAVLALLCMPFIFNWFFPKYMDSCLLGQILCLELIFSFPLIYLGYVMRAQRLLKLTFFVSLSTNLLRILLFAILGYFNGLAGVVLAKIMASLCGLVLAYSALRIELNKSDYE